MRKSEESENKGRVGEQGCPEVSVKERKSNQYFFEKIGPINFSRVNSLERYVESKNEQHLQQTSLFNVFARIGTHVSLLLDLLS